MQYLYFFKFFYFSVIYSFQLFIVYSSENDILLKFEIMVKSRFVISTEGILIYLLLFKTIPQINGDDKKFIFIYHNIFLNKKNHCEQHIF